MSPCTHAITPDAAILYPSQLQNGYTSLHVCAQIGQVDVAELLLDRGAAIEAKGMVSNECCIL